MYPTAPVCATCFRSYPNCAVFVCVSALWKQATQQLSDSEDSADTVLVPGARRALWEARARTAPAQRCAKVYTWLKMEDENGNRLSVPLQNSFEDLFAAPIRTVASSAAGGSKGSPGPRPAQQKDGSESKKRTLDGLQGQYDGSVDSVLDDPDMEGFDEFLEGLERDITEGDFSSLKGALSSEHNSQETEADPPVRVKQEPGG
ncbi:hypothetical protein FJT64_025375 [Amphibalanus amphitrite]|uniref:Uncharacterized protein n=1 Tax=Amphibalanus amphitrite TaxID=1232801 RepID=A0A6A4WIE6_AMPAM|nr:hypothetical protein FJT64_025375 [Amphibalanus amphitrite]